MLDTLISPGYLREQQILHAAPRGYGQRGRKWAGAVLTLIEDHLCATVLDYGCGTGSLKQELIATRPDLDVREYDPAIVGKDALPEPADLVVCTDVLEHVEEDKLDAVVGHLRALTRHVLFVVISIVPTAKTLTDGRQAHITLHYPGWWMEYFTSYNFTLVRQLHVKPEKQVVWIFKPC